MKRFIFLALAGLAATAQALAVPYTIDPAHTQIVFRYKHLGFSHLTGRLNQVTGTFDLDSKNLENSKISIQIPISSISTGVPKLDTHLQSADFFDAATYPMAYFTSTKVHAINAQQLQVMGDLNIRGVSKPVTLNVDINGIGMHPMQAIPMAGFDATTTIKRSDFGLGAFAQAVADDVVVQISLEARQAK